MKRISAENLATAAAAAAIAAVPFVFYAGPQSFSIPKTALAELAACLIFALRMLSPSSVKFALKWPVLIFLLIYAASCLFMPHPSGGLKTLLLFSCLAVFTWHIAIVSIKDSVAKLFFAIFALTAVVMSIHGMLQFIGRDFPVFFSVSDTFRVFSTAGSPAALAGWLAVSLILLSGLAAASRRPVLFALPVSVIAVCIIITGSRSGMLAAASGILFTAACLFLKERERFAPFMKSLAAAAGFAAAIILISRFAIPSAVMSTRGSDVKMRRVAAYDPIQKEGSIAQRIFILKCGVHILKSNPVTGFGPGSFTTMYPLAQAAVISKDPAAANKNREVITNRIATRAHNEFLEIAVESGIPGLFAFLSIIVFFFFKVLFAKPKPGHALAPSSGLRFFAAGAFFAICVQSAFEFTLHDPGTALALWATLGLCCGTASRIPETHGNRKPYITGMHLALVIAAAVCAFYAPRPLAAMLQMIDASKTASAGDIRKAVKTLEAARRLDPVSPELLLFSASVLGAAGDFDAAIQALTEAQKYSNSPQLYDSLGRALALAGRPDQAEEAFLTAASIDPWKPSTWHNLSQLYLRTGRPREAQNAYERAIYLSNLPPYLAPPEHGGGNK